MIWMLVYLSWGLKQFAVLIRETAGVGVEINSCVQDHGPNL